MNKLYTFGCSFTAGDGCRGTNPYHTKYKKNDEDDIWPVHVANALNMELINVGAGGYSNDMIFDSVIKHFFSITKDDVVILESTYNARIDVPYGVSFKSVNLQSPMHYGNYTDEEIEHIKFVISLYDNRLYRERTFRRFNFLRNLLLSEKNVKFCLLWDLEKEFKEHETIQSATNYEIIDYHWSFNGHRTFANKIIEKLRLNENSYQTMG